MRHNLQLFSNLKWTHTNHLITHLHFATPLGIGPGINRAPEVWQQIQIFIIDRIKADFVPSPRAKHSRPLAVGALKCKDGLKNTAGQFYHQRDHPKNYATASFSPILAKFIFQVPFFPGSLWPRTLSEGDSAGLAASRRLTSQPKDFHTSEKCVFQKNTFFFFCF